MTLAEALRLVDAIRASYPRQELRAGTVEVYANHLLDLPLDVAERAVNQVLEESAFWPSIAEIRKAAAEMMLDAPDQMEAWEQASRREVDRHPLVDRARRMVGDPYDWRIGETDRLRPAFIAPP